MKNNILPPGVLRALGCAHCDWHNEHRCQYAVLRDKGDGMKILEGFPKEGICDKRIDWALTYLPDYDKPPTHEQVMFDLVKGIKHEQHFSHHNEIVRLDQRYQELMSMSKEQQDEYRQEITMNRKMRDRYQQLYDNSSRELLKYENLSVDRQTPKKVEVQHNTSIPLKDLHAIMRKDYKKLEGGKNDIL